ncbi:MAG: nucleotidyltransferase domain-containing protein [Clostridia bacterium]|nr:nucleotidyltransferase domain-containing protein [Clostridia bacterium]
MDAKIDNDLDIIKESVLQAIPAEAIYLFGSHAYGTPREDSDIDIYVVVPDGTTELSELYADIMGLIRKNKGRLDLDLLMGCSSVFNRRKNGPTLERVIAQRGAVLYGA